MILIVYNWRQHPAGKLLALYGQRWKRASRHLVSSRSRLVASLEDSPRSGGRDTDF